MHSQSFGDHILHLGKVLESCKERNARLKLKKCEFARSEIVYLGNLVSNSGVSPDPSKVQAIKNLKVPSGVKDVRSFLGVTNYYRQFIRDYASIANPLNCLLKKNVKFEWGKEQQKAFDDLKSCLISAPILTYLDLSKELLVQTDASLSGIGCCLLQSIDGINHPVCYYSRSLKSHERNYSVGALEALAMVFAAKKLRHFVYDNANVVVQTDHRSLQYIRTYKGSNSTVARWWLKLDDAFSKARIEYIRGSDNVIADSLSRLLITSDVIAKAQANDDEISTAKLKCTNDERFAIDDGILKFKGRIYVPKDLRCELLSQYHEKSNHIGVSKMINLMSKSYYWSNINSHIARWCKSCDVCQKKKFSRARKERGVYSHSVGYP